MDDHDEKSTCIVMFFSGFSSLAASLMMMVCLLYMRGRNELEEIYLIVQLVLVNLLTSLAIIVDPFMNFMKNISNCQIGSSLTFCLIILTFGLKLTIFCARYQATRNNLARTNQNLTEISTRCLKVIKVIIWLIPIGIFVAVFIYFYREKTLEFIYRPSNYNCTAFADEDICYIFLAQDALLFAIYILVITVIMILCYQVTRMHHQANKNRGVIGFQQIRQQLQLRNKLFLETFLFVIWWAPCSALRIYNTVSYASNQEPRCIQFLFYMQAFMSPSQGTVDFILFLFGYPQITKCPNLALRKTRTVSQISSCSLLPECNAAGNTIPGNRTYSLRLESESGHVTSNLSSSVP